MNTKKNFEDNLKMFKKISLPFASRLEKNQEPQYLKFCKTANDELNLYNEKKDANFFYHNQENALKEAIEWKQKLDLDDCDVLYVYGVGLGYHYLVLKDWLKENSNRFIAFLEPNIDVIHRLMQTDIGYKMLHDSQIIIKYIPLKESQSKLTGPIDHDFVQELTMLFSFLRHKTTVINSYSNDPVYKEVADAITILTFMNNDSIMNNLIHFPKGPEPYGLGDKNFYINIISNIIHLEDSFLGSKLFNRFKNVPAIICGAGPSLKKNISLVKNLKDKALIFAGSSAFNVLTQQGILPHFGVYLDPYERVYDRYVYTNGFEIPMFFSARPYYKLVNIAQGPKLFVLTEGYPLERWLHKELKIESPTINSGVSVTCFSSQITQALGCNPIIYIGVDLGYTDDQHYASGVVSQAQSKISVEEDKTLIEKKDIYGKPILTDPIWAHESFWISSLSELFPKTTFINATEGGLGFQNIDNLPLKEVEEKYLKKTYSLDNWIHSEIINTKINRPIKKNLIKKLNKIKKSLEKCQDLYEIILNELLQTRHTILKNKLYPRGLRGEKGKQAEEKLVKEIAFQTFLLNIHAISDQLGKKEVYKLYFLPEEDQKAIDLNKTDILISRFKYLYLSAESLLDLIDEREEYLLKFQGN